MSCTVLLRNKGILFCHFVTGIRKSATKENKVSIENALLYRERKVILHINKKKPRTLLSRLSYGNKKFYKQYAEKDSFL